MRKSILMAAVMLPLCGCGETVHDPLSGTFATQVCVALAQSNHQPESTTCPPDGLRVCQLMAKRDGHKDTCR